jgi:hypothetical protein
MCFFIRNVCVLLKFSEKHCHEAFFIEMFLSCWLSHGHCHGSVESEVMEVWRVFSYRSVKSVFTHKCEVRCHTEVWRPFLYCFLSVAFWNANDLIKSSLSFISIEMRRRFSLKLIGLYNAISFTGNTKWKFSTKGDRKFKACRWHLWLD